MPALAGLAAPWWRSDATGNVHRDDPVHPARAPRPRAAAGHRRAGRRAGRPHRRRPGPPLTAAARRRRADALATADAGRRRPRPAPGRRSTPRRTPPRSARPRSAAWPLDPTLTLADAVPEWTPSDDLRAVLVRRPRSRVPRALARRRDRQPPDPARDDHHRQRARPPTSRPRGLRRRRDRRRASSASAIARELCRLQLSVALVEARDDVGDGTSKANTAILHTGFDAKPGTLESGWSAAATSCWRSTPLRPASRSSAPARCWSPGPRRSSTRCPPCGTRRSATATTHCEIVDAAEVYRQVPDLGPGALGGADRAGRVDHLHLDHLPGAGHRGPAARRRPAAATHAVDRVDVGTSGTTTLHTAGGDVARPLGGQRRRPGRRPGRPRCSATTGSPSPRAAASCWSSTSSPGRWSTRSCCRCRPSCGKGVLISPTIYGNVMLGPTAEDLDDRTATGTSEDGLAFLLDKGRALMPRLLDEEVTATYAGLRAAIERRRLPDRGRPRTSATCSSAASARPG